MLESTIEASEAAVVGDTRQKELFFYILETSPSTNAELFQSNLYILTNVFLL